MKLAHRLAALAASVLVSLSLGAADERTPAQLADRASQLIDEKKLDEAQAAIDEALAKQKDFAPALVQAARAQLVAGNDSRDAALKANPLLWRAVEADQRNGPALVLLAFVQDKIGNQPYDPRRWYYMATRAGGTDAPWLVPYHLWYAEKFDQEKVQHYRELYAKAGGAGDPKKLFEVHHELFRLAMYRHEREKSDAEYAEMMRLQPDEAFIPGDYSRGLMLHFQDFEAGERYARKALAMRDYPHARESLSLALYGKWAVAKRSGRDSTEVRALLAAAEANDPGAAHVPECALTWPPMKFLADSLDALGVKRRLDADTHDC
jgi:hypothetical protein